MKRNPDGTLSAPTVAPMHARNDPPREPLFIDRGPTRRFWIGTLITALGALWLVAHLISKA
jgi:hypothetical protein